jgi:PE family
MTLRVVPEGLTAAGSAVESLTARLAAVHAAAAPLVNAVLPPAADPVSLQTAAGFSAAGNEHSAVAALAVAELGRAGMGIAQSGANYATGDALAASTYLIARG